MAKLFKDNIIREKLLNFEIPLFDEKIKIINNWLKLYKDWTLKNKKEEELEWPFWDDFFWKILGYESLTENETYSRKFQPKVPEWWQKADIWLGIFWEEINLMKVIVELKDAKTSLDKPQQRAWNLTPVQQAFKYKPYFRECDFIIVSNFIETRIYIDSYYDYESFTLESLANPNNDYFEFKKFYYLLCKSNLITKSWDSNTKSLLSTIRIQEKEITKKFYKDYSLLRIELLRDLRDNNSQNWKISKEKLNLIFEKAQKIIDRIVFIHFCEDINDLLPNGKLKENLLRAEEIWFTPWDVLKIFFRWVDKWSEKLWIKDGYNWWLFAEDKDLDNLKVWDEICKKFVDLWDYDFANDLSVNILGHIFEQSISDIEEIKNKIQTDRNEKAISKRKKDGIFYTPEYIIDYIVKNSLGKYLEEKENQILEEIWLRPSRSDTEYINKYKAGYLKYQEILQNIKVLDPACGSWAFLVKVFDFLLSENKRVNRILEENWQTSLMWSNEYIKNILQNNIYWVDLNEESVEITKLSLWLKTAQKGKKLANLDSNIKCGNSLIDDEAIAWNKAFKWNEEFKEIMNNWGFDVIVGNPPYVPAEWIEENTKRYLEINYESAKWRINLYIIFYELWIKLLNSNGILWFITPYTVLKNKYYQYLRKYILNNTKILTIVDFQNFKVFEDAAVDSIILIFKKTKLKKYNFNYISDVVTFQDWRFVLKEYSIDNILISEDLSFVVNKVINLDNIEKNTIKISDVINFKQWIITWWNKDFITQIESELTKPVLTWSDFNKYTLNYSWDFIIYDKSRLHRARTVDIFEAKEKIILRQTWSYPIATIDFEQYYTLDTIHCWLMINGNFKIKYILCLLNSSFFRFLYWMKINEDWKVFAQVKLIYINELPIKNISLSEQQTFIEKADFMLEKNRELQEKKNKFLNRLKSSFWIEKISWKLENFHLLDFGDFVKELSKSKVNLSLKDQDEWEDYFASYKKEVLELKMEIDNCDKKIDNMVFDLYGLDEEERKVVLGS